MIGPKNAFCQRRANWDNSASIGPRAARITRAIYRRSGFDGRIGAVLLRESPNCLQCDRAIVGRRSNQKVKAKEKLENKEQKFKYKPVCVVG